MGLNQKVASYMGDNLNLDNDNREVLAYSLELLFHTSATVLLVLLVSWFIGPIKEAVILLIVMFLIKSFAGGVHCSSASRCKILSILLIPSFAQLAHVAGQYFSLNVLIIITVLSALFSFAIAYKYAPVNLPIDTVEYRAVRRKLTFLLIILTILVQVVLIAFVPAKTASCIVAIDISIFCQAFMLTKQGNTLINFFDGLLRFFIKKGGDNSETH